MPEAIGIEQTMDAANNLNIKAFLDVVLGQVVANNQQSQTQYNKHIARIDAIAEASLSSQLQAHNSYSPVEAAAHSRLTRTPSGEATVDTGAAIAAIQEMLRPGKPVTQPIGSTT